MMETEGEKRGSPKPPCVYHESALLVHGGLMNRRMSVLSSTYSQQFHWEKARQQATFMSGGNHEQPIPVSVLCAHETLMRGRICLIYMEDIPQWQGRRN